MNIMKHNTLSDWVKFTLLAAIMAIMAFVFPVLGYIPLGFTKATIMHIPVIIGSIMLGPVKGGLLGLFFGITSLINNTVNPAVTSFAFSPFIAIGGAHGNALSLVVCFVPRILVGIVPYFVKKAFGEKHRTLGFTLGGLAGSLTNTVLVMNFIYLFFGAQYAEASQKAVETIYLVILSVICINGIPEAIVASLLTAAICKALSIKRR